jgi:hypothetical protein
VTARVVGVRPPPTSPLWEDGRLRFADAGSLAPAPGAWVLVDAPDGAWVGQVVVAPEQIAEAAELGPLPAILRLATDAERPPARAAGAGLALLDSLDLPSWATRPASEAE